MSLDESSSITQDNHNQTYGTILRRSSTHIFDHSFRPSTPPLHRIESAPLLSPSVISTSTIQSSSDQMVSTIPLWTLIGYGLGHIYNDFCAGVWLSYTLLFMQRAIGLSEGWSGFLMMLGQVGDAIATPGVGYLVDKHGTKLRWHVFGTLLVFLSFPMIFSLRPVWTEWPEWWHSAYFIIVILLFQIGWPIVQVSHLAIIPELARTQKDRTQLTSMRYSASVVSSCIVFIVAWFVLGINSNHAESKITPSDAYRFRDISLILTLIGVFMTVLFHFSLSFSGYEVRRLQVLSNRRASLDSSYRRLSDTDAERQPITMRPRLGQRPRKNFFKSVKIYQYSLLYVFSRIFTTAALVCIPLWLDDRLHEAAKRPELGNNSSRDHLATVPLAQFLASFLATLFTDRSHRRLGHKLLYLLGSLICIGGCIIIELRESKEITSPLLYSISVLFGAGSSITMISSLCLIADMIGKHADQSGFVYAVVTFADKLITGVAIAIIQSVKGKSPDYYKRILSRVCGGAAVLGVLILFTLKFSRRSSRGAVRKI